MVGITLLVIAGITAGCGFFGNNKIGTKDPLRFKQEYEALNDDLKEDGTNEYTFVSVKEKNKIVYLTYDELIDFLGSKTGLLYFGRPGCPWCRLLLPALLQYAQDDNVDIYYYDIEKDRDENNDNYKNILAMLGEYLPTDIVTQDEDDPDFDPGLKRVVLPQLFFIKNGEVKTDLYLYRHEYLVNNESDNVIQLLRDSYASIASK
jgi:thiol-disulfide isomerase/thioredoxin